MIGGEEAVVERLRPIFETLAPAPDRGWGRVGAVGSGHYTKMIHNGGVVRSWLLDLTADALGKNPTLRGIAPYVADSGEGRWTAAEAIELGVRRRSSRPRCSSGFVRAIPIRSRNPTYVVRESPDAVSRRIRGSS